MVETADDTRVLMAVITGSRGLRGEVRIKSFAAEPMSVFDYGALEDKPGARQFEGKVTGQAKGQVFARLRNVSDRDTADALKGTELYLNRENLPAPDEDEFYHADLIGLRAETVEGKDLGIVRAVHDFGAGASLELIGEETGIQVFPFTKAVVPRVEVSNGRVVIDPPDDLVVQENEETGGTE